MKTETLTRTVICRLETSNRKNERVRDVVDEWQRIAGRMGQLMPSVEPHHWSTQDTTLYHLVQNEFPDHGLRSHDASQAAYKVGESFGSWRSNGCGGDRPQFGDGDYARFCHCGIAVEKNGRGWGVKVGLEPYNPEWWHINAGAYQREHLNRITGGDASTGSAELHLDGDDLYCHLSISEDVDVHEWGELDHVVGVDLGESVMYAVAVTGGGVKDVVVEPGREFRHHRERVKRKRRDAMERDDLRAVKEARSLYRRYTDHVTHEASRRIVDLAAEYDRAGIRLEDLTGYRESATDAIHDWPYAELQEKIAYKATEAGIPVQMVDPSGTSTTCRKCGLNDPMNRDGNEFRCQRCGYEVHADVNAAINIAGETR